MSTNPIPPGATPLPPPGSAARAFYQTSNVYLVFPDEAPLFAKWLTLPHPELQLSALRSGRLLRGVLGPLADLDLRTVDVGGISGEQGGRFARVATLFDVGEVRGRLLMLRRELEGALEEAKKVLGDEMMDFDSDDFKRLELKTKMEDKMETKMEDKMETKMETKEETKEETKMATKETTKKIKMETKEETKEKTNEKTQDETSDEKK